MKVFISSLISGFEPYRSAAKSAVTTLRHAVIMAEDFRAAPLSPQVACLQGVRDADVVVLILGERYGTPQPASGLSPTHEEYREARDRKPVIAFVQQGITPDPAQAKFIDEVQGWSGGLFRGTFRDEEELRDGIIGALHDYQLATATGPVDKAATVARAATLLLSTNRNGGNSGEPMLSLAVACAPGQRVLRPVEIESEKLRERLHQMALFGNARIFDSTKGVTASVQRGSLVLEQEHGALFQLDEQGSILIRASLKQREAGDRWGGGFPALVEEFVQQQIAAALAFAALTLECIDQTQRLTDIAIAARIDAGDYMVWQTRAEREASQGSGTVSMMGRQGNEAVTISEPRPALRLNTATIVEDLLVPLRRQWKTR